MASSVEFNEETLPELLPCYYKKLFPHLLIYRWLSRGNPRRFPMREISFTLLGNIYIRYLCFDSYEGFVHEICRKKPIRVNIGAIYTSKPNRRSRNDIFKPVGKEMVFDVDISDYDDIRICCSGANICTKCWKFMAIACKVLDTALREDFGFNNLLWVFSGRRGIHCWVCDPSIMTYNDLERSGMAEYFQLVRGGIHQAKKVILTGDKIHTSLKRAFKIGSEYFLTIVEVQDLLGNEEKVDTFLKLVVDDRIRSTLKDIMRLGSNSKKKWEIFENTFSNLRKKGQIPENSRHLIEEIKLQFTYPRLDIHVTKGFAHLLKAPFSIHPKTGKISVPFDPKAVDDFNPVTVPTINSLLDEIKTYDTKPKENEQMFFENEKTPADNVIIEDYKKTSLVKSMSLFEQFLQGLIKKK